MADDRQEKPTKRRQDKARKEGQFPASRELLNALQLLLFVYLLTTFGGSLVERLRRVFRAELAMAFHRTPRFPMLRRSPAAWLRLSASRYWLVGRV